MDFKEKTLKLIQGGYDLHIHPGPSHFPRCIDDFQLMQQADAVGMAGVMLKSHYEPTGVRAKIANQYAGTKKTVAYGAVALNWPVGGLNPYAADSALKMGGKIVWMPTRDAANSLEYGDMAGDFFKREGITIYDADRQVKPCVGEILEVVRKYGAFIATGHLYNAEILDLCRLARDMKVNVILTHPEWQRTTVPLEIQLQLADMGVLIEKCWGDVFGGFATAAAFADAIKKIGASRIIWGTDGGFGSYNPVEAIKAFIEAMLKEGVSEEDIHTMLCENPKQVVL